jgi:hypothetical protein
LTWFRFKLPSLKKKEKHSLKINLYSSKKNKHVCIQMQTLEGFEPAIFCSGGERNDQYATTP